MYDGSLTGISRARGVPFSHTVQKLKDVTSAQQDHNPDALL